MVRLVKGAYWDTEIKRAQERGLDDYPVFTRKAMTDLNYVACAEQLLALRPRIYPQFATHNALTVAPSSSGRAASSGFEFQRLHGMGEALYAALMRGAPGDGLPHLCAGRRPSRPPRLSGAPAAGERRQFLLRVRRGRSTTVPVADAAAASGRHHRLAGQRAASDMPLPRDLYGRGRQNSRGVELGDRAPALERAARDAIAAERGRARAACADDERGRRPTRRWPRRAQGFRALEPRRRPRLRARRLDAPPTCSRQRRGAFIALLQREGGKTLDDAHLRGARGRRFLPLLRRARPRPVRRRRGAAGADRREQRAAAARPRRLRLRSRRGIFRWRSSSARSRRRSWPAMPWSPSRPSRRR